MCYHIPMMLFVKHKHYWEVCFSNTTTRAGGPFPACGVSYQNAWVWVFWMYSNLNALARVLLETLCFLGLNLKIVRISQLSLTILQLAIEGHRFEFILKCLHIKCRFVLSVINKMASNYSFLCIICDLNPSHFALCISLYFLFNPLRTKFFFRRFSGHNLR